jgi:carbamate kinase
MRIVIALGGNALPDLSQPYPLDVLGAQTQGMIGYWLAQELANAGVTKPVLALVNQTLVDPDDAAFAAPTKFIGAGYTREQAEEAATRYGWTMAVDGDRWRRVVPSPEPPRVVEQDTIRTPGRVDGSEGRRMRVVHPRVRASGGHRRADQRRRRPRRPRNHTRAAGTGDTAMTADAAGPCS